MCLKQPMNKVPSSEENSSLPPHQGIQQNVEHSTVEGGMLSSQGNNNTQIIDNKITITKVRCLINITNYDSREDIKVAPVTTADINADNDLPCPYRGLFQFGPNDAEFFFGRDVLIEELIQATVKRNFIPVLGASGSGKSSVVLAGLVPKLQQQGNWLFTHFRPGSNQPYASGSDPFYALAKALVPLYRSDLDSTDEITQAEKLAQSLKDGRPLSRVFSSIHGKHPNHRVLLIADQFEELYTLCNDEKTRTSFLDTLLAGFQSSSGFQSPPVLVATMRADFLGNALSYPPFGDVLQNTDIKIRSMDHSELSQVIVKPAEKLGITFEAGLMERILDDIENKPGNLPLLEFALTLLWQKRTGKQLTHRAYDAIGNVQGALARYADEIYDQLNATEQQQVRRIFIQLVRPGEGTEDTLRLATKAELGEASWALVTKMADARLVVTSRNPGDQESNTADQETVEITHEALIRNWERLRQWIAEDRKFRVWQERLRVAMQQWNSAGRDEGALLRGKPLVEAQEWFQNRSEELTAEQEFITASLELQEREVRRNLESREVEAALASQKQANEILTKARKRAVWISVGAVFAFITAVVASYAVVGKARREAHEAQSRRIIAEVNSRSASSKSLFFSGQSFEALLEGLRAAQKIKQVDIPIPESDAAQMQLIAALNQAVYGVKEQRTLNGQMIGHNDAVTKLSFSPDGQVLTSISRDNTVKLWKRDGTLLQTLQYEGITDVSAGSDGQALISLDFLNGISTVLLRPDGSVTETPRRKFLFDKSVFSANGQFFATASFHKIVILWKRDGTLLKILKIPNITGLGISRDGKVIATAIADKTIKLWKEDGTLLTTLQGKLGSGKDTTHPWPLGLVKDISFSNDGKTIAAVSGDNTVSLWKQDGSLLINFTSHRDEVEKITFSPDGKIIATASKDKTVKLWKQDGTLIKTLAGHTAAVNDIIFSSDGQLIATASDDKTIKLWKLSNLPVSQMTGHSEFLIDTAFSPDGKMIATASADDNTVKLWKRDGTLLQTMQQDDLTDVSFSNNGQILITSGRDRRKKLGQLIKLWKLNGTSLGSFSVSSIISGISLSPDGQLIATEDDRDIGKRWKTVKLWKQDGSLLKTFKVSVDLQNLRFSPDGQTFLTITDDNTAKLWKRDGSLLKTLTAHCSNFYFKHDSCGKVYRHDISFSPNRQTIAISNHDQTANLWRWDGSLALTLKGVDSVSFSLDGQTIATTNFDFTQGSEIFLKLWKPDGTFISSHSFKPELAFSLNSSFPDSTFILSPDKQTIAIVGTTLKFQKLDGTPVKDLPLINSAEGENRFGLSPDGQIIATVTEDGSVKLWNWNAELQSTLGDANNDFPSKQKLILSPDKRTIVTTSSDATLKLWKWDGTPLTTLDSQKTGKLDNIQFSPDGQMITATSDDGTVILWNLNLDSLVEIGCNWIQDYLYTHPDMQRELTICQNKTSQK